MDNWKINYLYTLGLQSLHQKVKVYRVIVEIEQVDVLSRSNALLRIILKILAWSIDSEIVI